MDKKNLTELALKYRTDKAPEIAHSYIPYYEELFKDRNVKKLLEIGIGYKQLMLHVENYTDGASIYMWRDYFPEANIYACDIMKDILINEGRIRSILCNQGNVKSLNNLISEFGKEWDIIIDDGSHITEDQIISAKTLMPFVRDDGVYVIEDVKEPEKIKEALKEYKVKEKFFGKTDDRLIIITK